MNGRVTATSSGRGTQPPPPTTKTPTPTIQLKFLVLGAAAAGKTSILRRYFYRQFEYDRMPTLGSDFYVGTVPLRDDGSGTSAAQIRIQMWDTPGKENFAFAKGKRLATPQYAAALAGSFFQHADAVVLVYDMTSSTSFTRLLKWYADLLELFQKQTRPLPILIVANKLDLFQADRPGARHPPKQVPQRDVLGLSGRYYGKDLQYEYSVSTSPPDVAASSLNNNSEKRGRGSNGEASGHSDHNNSSKGNNKTTRLSRKERNRRRMEISTYLVTRDNWTNDGSYLESLLQSEDGSHPDREMVMLWCKRNHLTLYEVSAATGEGVSECVEALTQLALESRRKRDSDNGDGGEDDYHRNPTPPLTAPPRWGRNKELDLQERYAPKEENCFSLLPSMRQIMNR
jgi:GTPase SAR1 family protein